MKYNVYITRYSQWVVSLSVRAEEWLHNVPVSVERWRHSGRYIHVQIHVYGKYLDNTILFEKI